MRVRNLRRKKPTPFFPGGWDQFFGSLLLIFLGTGFCLVPLFFGWHGASKYGGPGGPGGAGALIIGLIFLSLGLIGLANSIFKFIIKIFK